MQLVHPAEFTNTSRTKLQHVIAANACFRRTELLLFFRLYWFN